MYEYMPAATYYLELYLLMCCKSCTITLIDPLNAIPYTSYFTIRHTEGCQEEPNVTQTYIIHFNKACERGMVLKTVGMTILV